METPKVIGFINLSGFGSKLDKQTNNTVLQCRDNRTSMALDNSEDEEEYAEIMEERQMFHWLQLGINKEITDKYFSNY